MDLVIGLTLGLVFLLLNIFGVFKRTRRYFRKRELARISARGPLYDTSRAVEIIQQSLQDQNVQTDNDTIIKVLSVRDRYVNSDESYSPRSGHIQDINAISKLLNQQGINIKKNTVNAIFDAEIKYLKEIGIVKE